MSFSLTRKTDYGLVALACLADSPNGDEQTLSARQIAEQYNLPTSLLMNVLKDLHRAGLVDSRRGAGGGYYLARDPRQITLLSVIEAIEGPVSVVACCDEDETEADEACVACRALEKCPITTPMQRFNELVYGFLSNITLTDLIHNQATVNLTLSGARG